MTTNSPSPGYAAFPGPYPASFLEEGDRFSYGGGLVEITELLPPRRNTTWPRAHLRSVATGQPFTRVAVLDGKKDGVLFRTDRSRAGQLNSVSLPHSSFLLDPYRPSPRAVPLTVGQAAHLDPNQAWGRHDRWLGVGITDSRTHGSLTTSTMDGVPTEAGWASLTKYVTFLGEADGGLTPAGQTLLNIAAYAPQTSELLAWATAVAAEHGISYSPDDLTARLIAQLAPGWPGTAAELFDTAVTANAPAAA